MVADKLESESQALRKKTKGKGDLNTPSPATGGKSRTTGKAKPTGEFPDLFAMFENPEETAEPPESTRTTPGRAGTTGSRATGEARSGSGSGSPDHAGAGSVSEMHSRSEEDALAGRELPPTAADIFGKVTEGVQKDLKQTASGRTRRGRTDRH